jgi:hypothetical protein
MWLPALLAATRARAKDAICVNAQSLYLLGKKRIVASYESAESKRWNPLSYGWYNSEFYYDAT